MELNQPLFTIKELNDLKELNQYSEIIYNDIPFSSCVNFGRFCGVGFPNLSVIEYLVAPNINWPFYTYHNLLNSIKFQIELPSLPEGVIWKNKLEFLIIKKLELTISSCDKIIITNKLLEFMYYEDQTDFTLFDYPLETRIELSKQKNILTIPFRFNNINHQMILTQYFQLFNISLQINSIQNLVENPNQINLFGISLIDCKAIGNFGKFTNDMERFQNKNKYTIFQNDYRDYTIIPTSYFKNNLTLKLLCYKYICSNNIDINLINNKNIYEDFIEKFSIKGKLNYQYSKQKIKINNLFIIVDGNSNIIDKIEFYDDNIKKLTIYKNHKIIDNSLELSIIYLEQQSQNYYNIDLSNYEIYSNYNYKIYYNDYFNSFNVNIIIRYLSNVDVVYHNHCHYTVINR